MVMTSDGRIRRNANGRRPFERLQPWPSTGTTMGACSSYLIDHIVLLWRSDLSAICSHIEMMRRPRTD
jgi:hypothetical protein